MLNLTPSPPVTSAAEAAAMVKRNLEDGSDGIKMFAQSGNPAVMSESTVQGGVAEAHRAGKLVFVHPANIEGLMNSVRGGVDIVAHTTGPGGEWDATIINTMKEHRVALMPTIKVHKFNRRHDRVSTQDAVVKACTDQLHAWLAAGGDVMFGTDGGYMD